MEFVKGMDLSTLLELEECGAKYYDEGKEENVVNILKKYGTNGVRLRLWVDPYSKEKAPYGAGTNDLPRTIEMAKLVAAKGMNILLNLHYSDFWADPGKQIKPKAWEGLSPVQIGRASCRERV